MSLYKTLLNTVRDSLGPWIVDFTCLITIFKIQDIQKINVKTGSISDKTHSQKIQIYSRFVKNLRNDTQKIFLEHFRMLISFFVSSKAPIRSRPSTILKKWCVITDKKFHRKLSKKEINYAQRRKMDFSSFQNCSMRTDFLNLQNCNNINKS